MAINNAATVSTANGIAKRVHGDVVNLLPRKGYKALKRVPFEQKMALGGEYAEQVWLTGEHGITYGGTTGAKRTLNESEVAESKLATLTPSAMDFRSEVTIDLMSRASAKGEKAFEGYLTALMRNSKSAIQKRLEIATRRGGSSIGTISSMTDANTTSVITITLASWAPLIWLGARNCPLDAYNSSTKLNTTAPLHVTVVNIKERKITVTGAAADIDAMIAIGTNGSGVSLYFLGQFGKDFTGIRTIANLSSGTYLGVSADDFADVWRGTQVTWDVSTTDFTWALLQTGLEEMAGRGMEGDVVVDVPNNVWGQLNSALDALRVFDSSYSVTKAEQGHGVDAISYHAITGRALIQPSGYNMYGEILVYPDGDESADGIVAPKRFGSSDVTFNVPGRGDEMFKLQDDTNTVEYRGFCDMALWLPAPRCCGIFTA
jgi:hypothetical protein